MLTVILVFTVFELSENFVWVRQHESEIKDRRDETVIRLIRKKEFKCQTEKKLCWCLFYARLLSPLGPDQIS